MCSLPAVQVGGCPLQKAKPAQSSSDMKNRSKNRPSRWGCMCSTTSRFNHYLEPKATIKNDNIELRTCQGT